MGDGRLYLGSCHRMGVSVPSVALTGPLYRGNVESEGASKECQASSFIRSSSICVSLLFGGYEEEVMTDMKMWVQHRLSDRIDYPFINRVMNKRITQSHSEQRRQL